MEFNFVQFQQQRNERREREQRELVKKLREEHENLSDLIYEDYRSGTDSLSSSDNFQEMRNKWHSAEDVRNRKVRHSIKFFNLFMHSIVMDSSIYGFCFFFWFKLKLFH